MEAEIVILYQDEAVLVCLKPPGADSQEGMCRRLSAQLGGEVFCVHRLDKAVGGVMVYARSAASAGALGRVIADNALEKEYLAVCEGVPAPTKGEMRDLLYHDAAKNKTFVVQRQRRGVREALLDYETLETREMLSLVRVTLHTGRSHQIRVQFASRRLPLFGDARYGAKMRGDIALWSHTLAFPHPGAGKIMRFTAPLPKSPPWNAFEMKNLPITEAGVM